MQNEYGKGCADWWGEGESPLRWFIKTLGRALIGVVIFLYLYPIIWGKMLKWGWLQ